MSLTTGEMSAADLAAVVGTDRNGGMWGGDGSWWIILLFLCLFNGGWGGNGGFGGNAGAGSLYPWMNQAEITSDGFRDQMINSNITGIRDGIAGLSTQLCNSFAQAEIADNGRQMANMNQAFAAQTAMNQGFNNLQASLAQCCCDNRLAVANLGSDIAREACATRTADTQNTQALLNAVNNGVQSIKDQLCQDKIDAKNEKIADLERQLTMANLAASQTAQNAFIAQGFSNEVDALYDRLNNCPVGTVPVYGRQPIFNCNNGGGCGCSCG